MSVTWRNRLAQRRLDLGLEGKDYDYLKEYMEHYCKKSDEKAKQYSNDEMVKTVDQVINSMSDPEFDRFTSGVIADVSRKLGRGDIANRVIETQESKDRKSKTGSSSSDDEPTRKKEEPIPA